MKRHSSAIGNRSTTGEPKTKRAAPVSAVRGAVAAPRIEEEKEPAVVRAVLRRTRSAPNVSPEALTPQEIEFGKRCLLSKNPAAIRGYFNDHKEQIDLTKVVDQQGNNFFHLAASQGDAEVMKAMLNLYKEWMQGQKLRVRVNPLAQVNLMNYQMEWEETRTYKDQNPLELWLSSMSRGTWGNRARWSKEVIKEYADLAPEALDRIASRLGFYDYEAGYHHLSRTEHSRHYAVGAWWEQSKEKLVKALSDHVVTDVAWVVESYLPRSRSLMSATPPDAEPYCAQPRQDPYLEEYRGRMPSSTLPVNFDYTYRPRLQQRAAAAAAAGRDAYATQTPRSSQER